VAGRVDGDHLELPADAVELLRRHVLRLLPMPQIVGHVRMLMLVHLASWRWYPHPDHVSADRQVDRQPPRQPGFTADDAGRLYTS
jgi:hypothetical protein